MMNPVLLAPHQEKFLTDFLHRSDEKTLLVAAPGTGKTATATVAAARLRDLGLIDRVLVLTSTRNVANQWRVVSRDIGTSESDAITYAKLARDIDGDWDDAPPTTRWLFVFDEADWLGQRADRFASTVLERFPGSRALFIASKVIDADFDARLEFNLQYFDQNALTTTDTRAELRKLAPSVDLVQRVQQRLIRLDDLNWREFETLLSQMLEADGYVVELMRGTKDGGVDVVASKDLGVAGLFKSVWQAKKYRLDRKVGISVVRELADTRLEHGASKGIIVTSSYLTKDALDRVERDRYTLGKLDRNDLDRWFNDKVMTV